MESSQDADIRTYQRSVSDDKKRTRSYSQTSYTFYQSVKSSSEYEAQSTPHGGITPEYEASGGMTPANTSYDWIIVAASFVNLFIIGAHFSSFSLLYPAITQSFQADYGVSGWIGSVSQTMVYLPAFLYSGAINRYGCRVTGITGALVAAVGYCCSSFTTTVWQLYMSYGVVAGTGVGMLFLPSIVIVQQYFTIKRALAAGISLMGMAIGPIIMSTPVQYCITTYGWRGTLFIYSAVCLNGLVCSSLFRPVYSRSRITLQLDIDTDSLNENSSHEICQLNSSHHAHQLASSRRKVEKDSRMRTESNASNGNSFDRKNQSVNKQEEKPLLGPEWTKSRNYSVILPQSSTPVKTLDNQSSNTTSFFTEVFDFSIMKEVNFILYGLATFCFNLGMLTFNMHTPSRALTYGVTTTQIAWLPTLIGIGNTMSRLIFSFVSNMSCTNRTLQYATGIFFGGITIITSTVCHSFITISLCCVAVGFCNGTTLTVQPVVLVDLFGVDRIAKSQAVLNLFIAVSSLLATPFSGFLFDVTGVYNTAFLVNGSVQVVGSILGMVIAILERTVAQIEQQIIAAF